MPPKRRGSARTRSGPPLRTQSSDSRTTAAQSRIGSGLDNTDIDNDNDTIHNVIQVTIPLASGTDVDYEAPSTAGSRAASNPYGFAATTAGFGFASELASDKIAPIPKKGRRQQSQQHQGGLSSFPFEVATLGTDFTRVDPKTGLEGEAVAAAANPYYPVAGAASIGGEMYPDPAESGPFSASPSMGYGYGTAVIGDSTHVATSNLDMAALGADMDELDFGLSPALRNGNARLKQKGKQKDQAIQEQRNIDENYDDEDDEGDDYDDDFGEHVNLHEAEDDTDPLGYDDGDTSDPNDDYDLADLGEDEEGNLEYEDELSGEDEDGDDVDLDDENEDMNGEAQFLARLMRAFSPNAGNNPSEATEQRERMGRIKDRNSLLPDDTVLPPARRRIRRDNGSDKQIRGRGRGRGGKDGDGSTPVRRGPRKVADPGAAFKRLQTAATTALLDGQFDRALRHARAAVKQNPEIYAAHSLLSEILQSMGREAESVAVLLSGAHSSREPMVWWHVSERVGMLGAGDDGQHENESEADKDRRLNALLYCFTNLCRIVPDEAEPRMEKVRVLDQLGRLGRPLIRNCELLLKLQPLNVEALRIMTAASLGAGKRVMDMRFLNGLVTRWDTVLNRLMAPYAPSPEYRDDGELANPAGSKPGEAGAIDPDLDAVVPDEGELSFDTLDTIMDLFLVLGRYADGIRRTRAIARWLAGRENETFWDTGPYPDDDREWDVEDEADRRGKVVEYVAGRVPVGLYGRALPAGVRVKFGILRLKLDGCRGGIGGNGDGKGEIRADKDAAETELMGDEEGEAGGQQDDGQAGVDEKTAEANGERNRLEGLRHLNTLFAHCGQLPPADYEDLLRLASEALIEQAYFEDAIPFLEALHENAVAEKLDDVRGATSEGEEGETGVGESDGRPSRKRRPKSRWDTQSRLEKSEFWLALATCYKAVGRIVDAEACYLKNVELGQGNGSGRRVRDGDYEDDYEDDTSNDEDDDDEDEDYGDDGRIAGLNMSAQIQLFNFYQQYGMHDQAQQLIDEMRASREAANTANAEDRIRPSRREKRRAGGSRSGSTKGSDNSQSRSRRLYSRYRASSRSARTRGGSAGSRLLSGDRSKSGSRRRRSGVRSSRPSRFESFRGFRSYRHRHRRRRHNVLGQRPGFGLGSEFGFGLDSDVISPVAPRALVDQMWSSLNEKEKRIDELEEIRRTKGFVDEHEGGYSISDDEFDEDEDEEEDEGNEGEMKDADDATTSNIRLRPRRTFSAEQREWRAEIEVTRRQWLETGQGLLDEFRTCWHFWPSRDKCIRFAGYSLRYLEAQAKIPPVARFGNAVFESAGVNVATTIAVPGAGDATMPSTSTETPAGTTAAPPVPTPRSRMGAKQALLDALAQAESNTSITVAPALHADFHGVPFDRWADLFCRFAVELGRTGVCARRGKGGVAMTATMVVPSSTSRAGTVDPTRPTTTDDSENLSRVATSADKYTKYETARSLLQTCQSANVFYHSRPITRRLRLTSLALALQADDPVTACDDCRWLIKSYPYTRDVYKLMSIAHRIMSVGGMGIGDTLYSAGPTQKFILRLVKMMDFRLLREEDREKAGGKFTVSERVRWANSQYPGEAAEEDSNPNPNPNPNIPNSNPAPEDDDDDDIDIDSTLSKPQQHHHNNHPLLTEHNPSLLTLYGHMLATGRQVGALNYYFRALALRPRDPVLNLSVAALYLQDAIKRRADNRHLEILLARAFLGRYVRLRLGLGLEGDEVGVEGGDGDGVDAVSKHDVEVPLIVRQEVAFNAARFWHTLGLLHLAMDGYERCLRLEMERRGDALDGGDGDGDEGWSANMAAAEMENEITSTFAPEAAYSLRIIYALVGNGRAARRVVERWMVM